MPVLAKLFAAIVVLFCAGCATSRKDGHAMPADWERPNRPAAPLYQPPGPAEAMRANPANVPAQPSETLTQQSSVPVNGTPALLRTGFVSLRDWSGNAGLPAPTQYTSNPAAFVVTSPSGRLSLEAGEQVARWNGMDVHLGFPPILIKDQLYLQAADIRSTIEPLLAPVAITFGSGHVIALDPGHGGSDSGATSVSGRHEKEFTLDWGLRLRDLLVANGWKVFLTRSTDTDVPLSNRVAFAESAAADLYLSLHFNSAPPDKAGLETYCLTPAGVPSTLTRGYVDELDLTLPNNSFDAQNVLLAAKLHSALLRVNGGRDRGIRRARFPTVLRTQNRPAVLIEGGYLSNPAESKMIESPAYRQKLAEAIAGALGRSRQTDAQNGTVSSEQ